MVDEAAGDKEKLAQDQSRLTLLRQRYAEFSKAAGLRTQEERAEVAGFGEKAAKSVAKLKNSATIGAAQESFVIGRSLGAKAKNYNVIDKQTGIIYRFVEGTKIKNPTVFAGYRGVKPLKEEVAEGLVAEFGGSKHRWQHAKGIGILDVDGEETKAEVHWFQEETVGKVKFKVKEWLDD